MRFTKREAEPLFDALEAIARGLGLALIELTVFRRKGGAQVKLTVYKEGSVGLADCSRAHNAMAPRLELAFPDGELSMEVSSPGIDRLIKDASEFAFYKGRAVKCYRTDISDWSRGILSETDEERLVLRAKNAATGRDGFDELVIPYKLIAKAKLDWEE
ncbi:MAG: ribosome assembly cofactor RimP [Treponema sp.]|jgi:ribosome maturation factor RimP|nr:ribosome assembly cofactor RimP [Treponema sp.]